MKKIVVIIFSIISISSVYSQKDPAAQVYLDKVSEKSKSSTAIQFNFVYEVESLEDQNLSISQEGTAILKGNKYFVDLKESHIFFDGESMYNLILDVNEITISEPEEDYDEFFLSNPAKIFSFYKEDFKYRLTNEFQNGNKTIVEIDLHPNELERTYYRVRLHIDKKTNEIIQVKIFEKQGGRFTIKLSDYKYLNDYADSKFTFDPQKNPKVEIIDMRGL
jgi:outer membrane lipoprotein-sorting protein